MQCESSVLPNELTAYSNYGKTFPPLVSWFLKENDWTSLWHFVFTLWYWLSTEKDIRCRKQPLLHDRGGMLNVYSNEQWLNPELNSQLNPHKNSHIVIFESAHRSVSSSVVFFRSFKTLHGRIFGSLKEQWNSTESHGHGCVLCAMCTCVWNVFMQGFVYSWVCKVWLCVLPGCSFTHLCRMSNGDSLFTFPSLTCQWLQCGPYAQQAPY